MIVLFRVSRYLGDELDEPQSPENEQRAETDGYKVPMNHPEPPVTQEMGLWGVPKCPDEPPSGMQGKSIAEPVIPYLPDRLKCTYLTGSDTSSVSTVAWPLSTRAPNCAWAPYARGRTHVSAYAR